MSSGAYLPNCIVRIAYVGAFVHRLHILNDETAVLFLNVRSALRG